MKIINNEVETCRTCGCRFEYDKSEIKTLMCGTFVYYALECPKCGQRILLIPDVKFKQPNDVIEGETL